MESRVELTRRGRAANAAARHDEALELWSGLRATDPGYLPALEGVALSLIGLGRAAEVAALAAAETGPLGEVLRALLAQSRPDWPEALARWRAARAGGLDRPRVTLGIVTALLRLDLAAEAAREARAGLERGPEHPGLRRLLAEAVAAQLDLEPFAPPPAPAAPPPGASGDDAAALRALLAEFTSLGRNCEFGLLQRRFGAEPLGLLRWGTTLEAALVRALGRRFEGVGDPQQTEIRLIEDEYRAFDTRYRFIGHTTIRGDQAAPETVHRKQSQRLGFLARMLVDELETQARIFVYQSPRLAEAQISAIYRALSAYGPNFLLCVRLADAAHPAGSMAVKDRLLVGYIDRAGRGADGTSWDISVDHWLAFCRAASARRSALLAARELVVEPVPA